MFLYGYISIEISTFKMNSKGGFLLRNKTNLEGVYVAVPDRTHYYKLYITKKVKIQTFATYRKTYDYKEWFVKHGASNKRFAEKSVCTMYIRFLTIFTLEVWQF